MRMPPATAGDAKCTTLGSVHAEQVVAGAAVHVVVQVERATVPGTVLLDFSPCVVALKGGVSQHAQLVGISGSTLQIGVLPRVNAVAGFTKIVVTDIIASECTSELAQLDGEMPMHVECVPTKISNAVQQTTPLQHSPPTTIRDPGEAQGVAHYSDGIAASPSTTWYDNINRFGVLAATGTRLDVHDGKDWMLLGLLAPLVLLALVYHRHYSVRRRNSHGTAKRLPRDDDELSELGALKGATGTRPPMPASAIDDGDYDGDEAIEAQGIIARLRAAAARTFSWVPCGGSTHRRSSCCSGTISTSAAAPPAVQGGTFSQQGRGGREGDRESKQGKPAVTAQSSIARTASAAKTGSKPSATTMQKKDPAAAHATMLGDVRAHR